PCVLRARIATENDSNRARPLDRKSRYRALRRWHPCSPRLWDLLGELSPGLFELQAFPVLTNFQTCRRAILVEGRNRVSRFSLFPPRNGDFSPSELVCKKPFGKEFFLGRFATFRGHRHHQKGIPSRPRSLPSSGS